ncbi:cytochrome b [Scytonema sp. PCC 10023]|uniref:cytochrome b n=1 Tax=Scytonema sp. PCC 10023 TaxID=1680591 RepID=UPI0039C70606
MQSPTSSPPFKRIAFAKYLRSLHWWMAIVFLMVYLVGIVMARLPGGTPLRSNLIVIHKSFAVLSLGLLCVRIILLLQVVWQRYSRRLPRVSEVWLRSVMFHAALYVSMLAVPISGIFYSNTNDRDTVFFGIVLPRLFRVNESLSELSHRLHIGAAYIFLGLILLHILDQRKFVQSFWRRFKGTKTKNSSR